MKKLGLIGGTGPESTILYYKGILSAVQQPLPEAVLPELVIESLSVFCVLDFCRRRDYAGLTAYLLKGMQNLKNAGADFAALTGITPYIVFNELQRQAPLPIISMAEAAADYAKTMGYKKAAVLGTLPTMQERFFTDAFIAKGVAAVVPSAAEQEYIGTKIETELEYGKVLPETKEKILAAAARLAAEEKADVIVLGCTELPLVFNGTQLAAPQLDVMQVHIKALVDKILE